MRTLLIITLLTCLGMESSQALILRVPEDYDFILAAIVDAEEGDTVMLAPGVYRERIDFEGRNIVIGGTYLVDRDTSLIEETVLTPGDDEGSIVVFDNNENEGAVLEGLTLQGGVAPYGGGIYIANASPRLRSLRVTGCEARQVDLRGGVGGGIYWNGGQAYLFDVRVDSCRALYAAGLQISGATGELIRCGFRGNESTGVGQSPARAGAIMAMTGRYEFRGCTIEGNVANGGGAGLYAANSTVNLDSCHILNNVASGGVGTGGGLSFQNNTVARVNRCLIVGNSATVQGGAITMYLSRADIVNTTITGNDAGREAGAIYQLNNSHVVAVNSIIWDNGRSPSVSFSAQSNSFTIAFSCFQFGEDGVALNNGGELNWEEENTTWDPLFVGEGDYHLWAEVSPCIDTGTQAYSWQRREIVWIDDEDFFGAAPDIGCYEFVEEEEESVPPGSEVHLPGGMAMAAWPNPFNGELSIAVRVSSRTGLAVFDGRGRQLEVIATGALPAGSHRLVWRAGNLPSGTYHLRPIGKGGGNFGPGLRVTLLK